MMYADLDDGSRAREVNVRSRYGMTPIQATGFLVEKGNAAWENEPLARACGFVLFLFRLKFGLEFWQRESVDHPVLSRNLVDYHPSVMLWVFRFLDDKISNLSR